MANKKSFRARARDRTFRFQQRTIDEQQKLLDGIQSRVDDTIEELKTRTDPLEVMDVVYNIHWLMTGFIPDSKDLLCDEYAALCVCEEE